MDNPLSEAYWNERYLQDDFPWDLGKASAALVAYFSTIKNKEARILIPGAGNGYEAARLFFMGFENVFLLDWAEKPLVSFRENNPYFPVNQIIRDDFFKHSASYDYVIEQTFFCALLPAQRPAYVEKMEQIIVSGGRLSGLLFSFPLNEKGPPFGGSEAEYRNLFRPHFEILTLEPCEISEAGREGKELFFELRRP